MCGIWEELAKASGNLNEDFPFLLWQIQVADKSAEDYLWDVPPKEKEFVIYVQCPSTYPCFSGAAYSVWGEREKEKAKKLGFEVDIYVERSWGGSYFAV